MQILEQNENEKQRVNGNAAIYMYKRKTTGKFQAFRLDLGVPLENLKIAAPTYELHCGNVNVVYRFPYADNVKTGSKTGQLF